MAQKYRYFKNVQPWNVDYYSHVGFKFKNPVAVECGFQFLQPFRNRHFQFRLTNQIQNRYLYCVARTSAIDVLGRPVRSASQTSVAPSSDKLYSYYATTVHVSQMAVNLDGGEIGVFRLQDFYHTTDFFMTPSFLHPSRCTPTYTIDRI